jgi:hypothetical protein
MFLPACPKDASAKPINLHEQEIPPTEHARRGLHGVLVVQRYELQSENFARWLKIFRCGFVMCFAGSLWVCLLSSDTKAASFRFIDNIN